MEHFHEKQ
jgi:hypothetical protein